MGLFSRSRPTGDDASALTPTEAFAGIAMCAMYADGVLDAEEDDELAVVLARLPIFREHSDDEIRDAFQKTQRMAQDTSDTVVLDACAAALPPRLRPAAYLVAADLIMTDGDVGSDEHAFLRRLQEKLGIDAALAAKIREVLAIKQVV